MSRRISRNDPKLKEIDEQYKKNVGTVKFTRATTKDVCSTHSGSILAAEEPCVPLSNEFQEKIDKLFDASEGICIRRKELRKTLVDCFGFKDYVGFEGVITKIYGNAAGDDEVTESDFRSFLVRFHAPAYYYGQRLRRSAGRGLVNETLELIIRGCNPNTADGEGLTAVHYASEFNQTQVIEKIAQICPPGLLILDARCKYGWTPLYCAAHHGNSGVVELLLKLGASCDVCSSVGKSPLHAAAAQGRFAIVDMIVVESTARAEASASHSRKANQRASSPSTMEMVGTDAGEAAPGSPSEGGGSDSATAAPAAALGNATGRSGASSSSSSSRSTAQLQQTKLLVNVQDKHGMTAIHEAAYKGQEQVFHLLCKVPGADLSLVDVMGNQPRDYLDKIQIK